MSRATCITLILARFDSLRETGPVASENGLQNYPGLLFCRVGADTRAAATEPTTQQAYTFLIYGLHTDVASAHRHLDERNALAPWLSEAREVWAGVLEPFRHKGEANYLNPQQPGPLFETLAPAPPATSPFVVITTVGWDVGPGLDRNRVLEFSRGVGGVRIAMTGNKGLHSQQTFFFPGVLETDPMTVTFWRDEASLLGFAYAPGVHRDQMARDRQENWSDRTSFTRGTVLRSEGSWYGSDPQVF